MLLEIIIRYSLPTKAQLSFSLCPKEDDQSILVINKPKTGQVFNWPIYSDRAFPEPDSVGYWKLLKRKKQK